MAYPGGKKKHAAILKALGLPHAQIVVDGFYGSGGLSAAYREAYPPGGLFVIAGESFKPLCDLYWVKHDLTALAVKVMQWINVYGIDYLWTELRDALQGRSSRWEESEAFIVLNNLGFGNSMRHGHGRHNINPCTTKVAAMVKRGRLLDPIALRPDRFHGSWEKAINAASGPDSTFLGDPPYQKCSGIYPTDNWIGCAVPPVELAMSRDYGSIVMFNNFSQKLNGQYQDIALQHGYTLTATATNWKTKFKPGAKPKGEEWVWAFQASTISRQPNSDRH